jgi:hypothetical protein
MKVIQGSAGAPAAAHSKTEYGPMRAAWERIKHEVWHWRLRRWLPRLVWLGDEVDVTITFSEDTIRQDDPFAGLFSGGLYDIQKRLCEMGVTFDTGCGCEGRDWEFDWSLEGPVRVKFRGRARNPEHRMRQEKPKPKLVA